MRTRLPHGLLLLAILVGLQIVDVAIHAATQQVEPVRITSNAIIVIGAIFAIFRSDSVSRFVIFLSATVYFVLNAAFIIHHGVINSATASPRIPLFLFVLGSLLLMYWLRLSLLNKTRR